MADSTETRILKDINRHLAHIDEKDVMTSSDSDDLGKNVNEVLGTFSSLVSSEMKNTINATNKAIKEAFGNLKGFAEAEEPLMEEVVDELKMNNRFMAKSEQNAFLAEAEREQDLNINRRTNDLLEDLVEKEDEAAAISKKESSDSKSFLGGMFGGLLGGKGIKGLLGAGKKLFFPALLAVAGFEFLKGWKEAGEDASVMEKFTSGLSGMISDLTFGLISKDFLNGILGTIQNKIQEAWDSFANIWKDEMGNFGENLDKTISQLTLGLMSEEDIANLRATTNSLLEKFNKGIQGLIMDALGFDLNTAVQDFYAGIDSLIDDTVKLFTDPIGLLIEKLNKGDEGLREEAESEAKRAKEGDLSQLDDDELLEKLAEGTLTDAERESMRKRGNERAKNVDSLWKKTKDLVTTSKDRIDAYQVRKDREARGRSRLEELQAKRKEESGIGSKGIEEKIALERALTNFKRQQEQPQGNAMQINNNNTISAPVDTRTENDDLNLRRSSEVEGTW